MMQPSQFHHLSHQRRFPIGAEVMKRGVHFRVWAPLRKSVDVLLPDKRCCPLTKDSEGYFSGFVNHLRHGDLYQFRLDEQDAFGDPASRFQPQGVHGPSQVIDPDLFSWTDQQWTGVSIRGQILYELHVGTFTPEGTWRSAAEQLPELVETGITIINVMPVAEFPGQFGWGYDGTYWFAPTRLYGDPDDFRFFVNRAHELNLGVTLDVVYNHWGPDGNYHAQYSPFYISSKQTSWGDAINFDGPGSHSVRELVTANVRYWIKEFHIDGFRLDATHEIFDTSPEHIIAELTRSARQAAYPKNIIVVAENDHNDSRIARSRSKGGYGLDGYWNDDFHHSAYVALTGQNAAYYADFQGSPQELISSTQYGYLYQGQYRSRRKSRCGSPAFDLPIEASVIYLENHDQVANSITGDRLIRQSDPGNYRAMVALLLLSPGTPMIFQGQESGALNPFCFFADHHADLAPLVHSGRLQFLSQFPGMDNPQIRSLVSSPCEMETVKAATLEPATKDPKIKALFRDLIQLRKHTSTFCAQRPGGVMGAVLGEKAFVLRFFEGQNDRLLLINLGPELNVSASEPLLAPVVETVWSPVWNSSQSEYGGEGILQIERETGWVLPEHCAIICQPISPQVPD